MYQTFGQYNSNMNNKPLSWIRKYNNNNFIIVYRAYFQHEKHREGVKLLILVIKELNVAASGYGPKIWALFAHLLMDQHGLIVLTTD